MAHPTNSTIFNATLSALAESTESIPTTTRGRGTMDGPGDAVWILTSAFIIFTMISGFGLVESGMVSRKNEANIMVKNAVDVIFGGLGFWMFGFAFTFGDDVGVNAFSGFGNFFTDAEEAHMGEVFALYCFQASFATTATTIVSGAVAERMNLKAYMIFAFTNTLTYCFPAHWVWGKKGWLKDMGVVDMGGASPVHLVGGVAGLVATLMLKPRVGRFKPASDGNLCKHKMGSPTNVLLGMFMLWWGWLGFNCGSTFGVSGGRWKLASRSAVCTINASCGGGIFATFYSYFVCNRLDIPFFMAGVLGSLVSITAICGVVRPGESLAIGFIGGAIAIIGWQLLNKIKIDDPVGAISTHAGGSIWGMLAVGLFVEKDSLEKTFSATYGAFKGGHVKILGVQLLACVSITAWTMVTVFFQLYAIDKSVGLRFPLEEEILGADMCEHGIEQIKGTGESYVNPLPLSRNKVHPVPSGNNELAEEDFSVSSSVCEEGNHLSNGVSLSRASNSRITRTSDHETGKDSKNPGPSISNGLLKTKHDNQKRDSNGQAGFLKQASKDSFLADKTKMGSISLRTVSAKTNNHSRSFPPNGEPDITSRRTSSHGKKASVKITITPADEPEFH